MLVITKIHTPFYTVTHLIPVVVVRLHLKVPNCSGNAESQLERVIKHLVGRQGQPNELRCMQCNALSDRKG